MLRQLKRHLALSSMPLSYFTNIGTIIRKNRLLAGEMYSDEVFVFVDEDESADGTETVPAASYMCLCSDKFSMEEENAGRLLECIEKRGYAVCGDYICEVMLDFTAVESSGRDMYYKIQIPVRFFGSNI